MCGIVGFVGAGDRDVLAAMNETLVHRGPDDQGVWHDPNRGVYLAMRRLAVLDLDHGAQPMERDGVVIVFNGEIYNHGELRKTLMDRGHRFVTHHSDTETLLMAYLEWGSDCLSQLNGMWAFAIYDGRRKQIWCARDRFGQKPFYYHCGRDLFAFASELNALGKHPKVPGELDPLAVAKYFGYGFVPAPHSVMAGVKKLPAGCHMTYNLVTGQCLVETYWDYHLQPEPQRHRQSDGWVEEFRALLQKAVDRRLAADVPVGVFLSGGVDSSMVAACAVRSHAQIQSFSLGFEDPSFDESTFARQAAQHLGTEHHQKVFGSSEAIDLAGVAATNVDEPFGDASLLPTHALSAFAAKQVTVALGGDGADELLCGYDPFRALRAVRCYDLLVPRPMHRAIVAVTRWLPVSHRNFSLDFKLKRTLRGLSQPWSLRFPAWLGPLAPDELNDFLTHQYPLEEIYQEAIELWEGWPVASDAERLMRLFIKLYLQDDILAKIDRASMWSSLEVRSPFLDIDLVDFLSRVPTKLKFDGRTTKWILKTAAKPYLPTAISQRPKKGFGVPIGAWLAQGKLNLTLKAIDPWLNGPRWRGLVDEHRRNRCDHRAALWNAWMLDRWWQQRRPGARS